MYRSEARRTLGPIDEEMVDEPPDEVRQGEPEEGTTATQEPTADQDSIEVVTEFPDEVMEELLEEVVEEVVDVVVEEHPGEVIHELLWPPTSSPQAGPSALEMISEVGTGNGDLCATVEDVSINDRLADVAVITVDEEALSPQAPRNCKMC